LRGGNFRSRGESFLACLAPAELWAAAFVESQIPVQGSLGTVAHRIYELVLHLVVQVGARVAFEVLVFFLCRTSGSEANRDRAGDLLLAKRPLATGTHRRELVA
jgi:hypothetical protein